MPSFHYNVNFKSDVRSFVIVLKMCYQLLLHSKHVLNIEFFS
jgi:hypothetical protein